MKTKVIMARGEDSGVTISMNEAIAKLESDYDKVEVLSTEVSMQRWTDHRDRIVLTVVIRYGNFKL